jgi:hypothetical protein
MASGLLGAPISQTYTGTLGAESGTPGSVVVEPLDLTTASSVTIFTTSYGGGTNLNGSMTSAGGLQPNVTLFDTTGFAVATESGMFSPLNNSWDAYILDSDVAAGNYFLILTDQANQVSAAFTGFDGTAPADFYTLFTGPGGSSFTDVEGNARNGNYALNVQATPLASPTPEPATFWLVVPVLAGALLFVRKRKPSLF